MFGIMEAISAYILVVGMAALLLAVLIWQKNRTGKTIRVWLFSSLVGIVLGATIPVAICYLAGYEPTKIPPEVVIGSEDSEEDGMMGGMGGGMGGMMGGPPSDVPAGDAPAGDAPTEDATPDQPVEE